MLIWIVCGLGILMLFLFVKTGRPVRCLLTSTIGGGLSFWRLNLLSGLTGVALSLNLASAVSAVLLGAPGVCSLWLLKLLWKEKKEGVSGEKAPLFSTLVQSPLSGQDQYFSVCFSCRIFDFF